MAHFARVEDGIVRQVIVVNNDVLLVDGVESETIGAQFCADTFGGTWVQTSYNGTMRGRYAGVGYTYDEQREAFIAPQPFPSWTLDDVSTEWAPPTPRPEDGRMYAWDEPTLRWVAQDGV